LLMGKYVYIFTAIKELNIVVILVFGLGCIVGILAFSRTVSWLLKNFYNVVIGLMAGFMIGSLNKIWPWKIVTSYRINSEGVQVPLMEENVTPTQFIELTGNDPQVLYAVLLALVGVVLVIVIEKLGSRYAAASK
jgi:putative membrane protein